MQIKAITVNAAGMMTAGAGVWEKRNQMQSEGGMFGPECRVTISREGKCLSSQQTAPSKTEAQNVQSARKERALLRQQDEADRAMEITEGYRKELNEIDEQIKALNASYASWEEEMKGNVEFKNSALGNAMKETVEELKNLKEAMQEQKDFQTEEAKRRMMEAQQKAMQQSVWCNEEIDENNRELVALLRTIEEAEKAEDGQEDERTESGSGSSGAGDLASDAVRNSAMQFMMSSADREKRIEEMLERAGESGRSYFDVADAITRSVLQKTEDIRAALDNRAFTDEQIEEMMLEFREEMKSNYGDVKYSRSFGMDVLRNVRDARIQRAGDDPLKGMAEVKRSMMLSAADAALGEARQSALDKTSGKLAEEVQKLIDERNDINKTPEEKKKEEDEQEKMQEELQQQEVM